jgi:hypothetical protein
MPTQPSFAERMVTKLETMLLENVGVTSVNVDGVAVSYADLEEKYAYWKRKRDAEQGRGRTVSQIIVGGKT